MPGLLLMLVCVMHVGPSWLLCMSTAARQRRAYFILVNAKATAYTMKFLEDLAFCNLRLVDALFSLMPRLVHAPVLQVHSLLIEGARQLQACIFDCSLPTRCKSMSSSFQQRASADPRSYMALSLLYSYFALYAVHTVHQDASGRDHTFFLQMPLLYAGARAAWMAEGSAPDHADHEEGER